MSVASLQVSIGLTHTVVPILERRRVTMSSRTGHVLPSGDITRSLEGQQRQCLKDCMQRPSYAELGWAVSAVS